MKHALVVLAVACGPRPPPAPATEAPVVAPSAPAAVAPAPYTAADLGDVVKITEVALSPRGDELAWVSDASGSQEVWTAPIVDGVPGAAVQRTDAGETVSGLAYGPDGSLVFEMDHGGDERYDLWRLVRGGAAEPLVHGEASESNGVFSPDGTKLAFLEDSEKPFQPDVAVLDLATGAVTAVTHEEDGVWRPVWSLDGKRIAAVVSADYQRGGLIVADLAGAAPIRIAPPRPDGLLVPEGFLPSGRVLATTVDEKGFAQLTVVDLPTGPVRVGVGEWDVEHVDVGPDGTLLISRNVRGASQVSIVRGVEGEGSVETVSQSGVVADVAVAAGRAAYVRESSDRPSEVVLVDLATSASRVAVPGQAGSVDPNRLVAAELLTYASFDGTPIDAWVYRPPSGGSLPPLVIMAHGGPSGQARPEFRPFAQSLAQAGFVVAAPNYRGSIGYGRAFEDLNNKDWGGGDLKDLLAVVDGLGADGIADPNRVGILGGSYGGYLVLRAITATPERWSAAVDLYGMPDLVKDYELTKDRFGAWYEIEMGTPETDGELFRERSPIHALDRITAPLLVLQGVNDNNVPKWESDLIVEALDERRHPVDYVVYRDEGHGFTHRDNIVDSVDRSVEFLRRYLAP